MRRDFFDYVERIRASEKYFDASIPEIRRVLRANGGCELFAECDFEDDTGDSQTVSLRLNIAGGPERPLTAWTVSLKLHNERIDGIDDETVFDMPDGQKGRGWHRHHWDSSEGTAKYQKMPLPDFHSVASEEQFLIRGLSILRIRTNSVDHGLFSA